METVHKNFIDKAAWLTRQLLDMYGDLAIQNTLWTGTPNYTTVIDDTYLQTEAEYVAAGLTDTTLTDAIYALEVIRSAITNALPALSVLSTV